MNVLVGISSPENSVAPLTRIADRAAATGEQVTVAIVGDEYSDADREKLEQEATDVLSDAGVSATIRQVTGEPGTQLVDIAESEGFDEVVIGGGTTSPMGKIKIDKTTEFVLLNSHTTVTLVR